MVCGVAGSLYAGRASEVIRSLYTGARAPIDCEEI